jgi:two-component system nitrogen regulation sensor histidine kinase NtrY
MPFFSSKPDGQGIGLTLIREILINHDFTFLLKTGTDSWTDFVIHMG